MKTLKIIVLLGIILSMLFACGRKLIPQITYEKPQEISNWQEKINNAKGVLQFSSWSELEYISEQIENLDFSKLEELSKQKDFYSQLFLYKKVQAEEERIEDITFKKYENLTDKEFKNLNLPYPEHTGIYQKYVQSGMIKVQEDSDTANVYLLSSSSPDIAAVLNEQGVVIVADTIYQFVENQIKKGSKNKIKDWKELVKAQEPNQEKGIDILNLNVKTNDNNRSNRSSNICYYWTGNTSKSWTHTGNKRRARYTRYGWSCTNPWSRFSQVKYYVRVEAQRKRWGKWKYRNSYKPVFRFSGNWSGAAIAAPCSNIYSTNISLFHSQFPIGTGVTTSPMSNRTYQGNNSSSAIKLHPHNNGHWVLNSYWCWKNPLNINTINITGTADWTTLSGG